MSHLSSVFANLCLKVPVDPLTKMPKSAYERKKKLFIDQNSIDCSSTCSAEIGAPDEESDKLKNFYRSIPDYNDINHLPPEEFDSTLKSLREKKRLMLGLAIEPINANGSVACDIEIERNRPIFTNSKPTMKIKVKRNRSADINESLYEFNRIDDDKINRYEKFSRPRKTIVSKSEMDLNEDLKITSIMNKEKSCLNARPKIISSACSISWNDKIDERNDIDVKFDKFFDGSKFSRPISRVGINNDEFKTQSMPSSPLRMKRVRSPTRRKSITVPKPFKMTERNEDERTVKELRSLQKSFSEDMLNLKRERRNFRARPVPIESRIALYDKILEDQAMRRAINKINSEAELQAQMKPFSFAKKGEKCGGISEMNLHAIPKNKKKKRFRARPIPKNLFSNYIYDKMKENEYFRSMNRRIRAEEMLRNASYPGNMAARDRSRLSTPAAHSDLPIDPSVVAPSTTSSDRQRSISPTKVQKKKDKMQKEDFITTSPQPFRFNTADRAAKKMKELTKKIYQESKSTDSVSETRPRAYSALELHATAAGRSNLAALLRAEAVRRRFEMESSMRSEEQRRRNEMRHRDRLLRSNPAWHLVKNNHEEDIAMRLQTRRDEERMRREEFLHEMELMYGRVQQQPMLFERYYKPRPYCTSLDTLQLSPRKVKKSSKKMSELFGSPCCRARKVSINDSTEAFKEYLKGENDDKLVSDSEDATNRDKL